jgi:uncharacterized protein
MEMPEKIKKVEEIFRDIDAKIARFNPVTGLKCPEGCVQCCLNHETEASVLEFLPLAFHLVSTNQFQEVIEKIENEPPDCVNLTSSSFPSSKPGCRFYPFRGLICRLFGSAVVPESKSKKYRLYACRTLKENYSATWNEIQIKINLQPEIPKVSDFYYGLHAIDPTLAGDYYPINQSIYKAISIVLPYFYHH